MRLSDKTDTTEALSTLSTPTKNFSATINGARRELQVKPHWTLVYVLREKLELTGTKETCGEGACGSCTVLVDGVPTLACLTLAVEVSGKEITTVEGFAEGNELHPIQEAFLEERGTQCGYCTPGMLVSTKHLLDNNPSPSEVEIRDALAGNICRCAAYEHIIQSVQLAAEKLIAGELLNEK